MKKKEDSEASEKKHAGAEASGEPAAEKKRGAAGKGHGQGQQDGEGERPAPERRLQDEQHPDRAGDDRRQVPPVRAARCRALAVIGRVEKIGARRRAAGRHPRAVPSRHREQAAGPVPLRQARLATSLAVTSSTVSSSTSPFCRRVSPVETRSTILSARRTVEKR